MDKLYTAKIIADSIAPSGKRLTTAVLTFPKSHQAELNTHRWLSRNSASSRAVPVEKLIKRIMDHPALPPSWGKNQKGMSAEEDVSPEQAERARDIWLDARNDAARHAMNMVAIGIHKQIANRLIETWVINEIIVSTTETDNFFRQRCDKHADPSFQQSAYALREAIEDSKPCELKAGEWHLPYVEDESARYNGKSNWGMSIIEVAKISSARCARVSYLNHEGKRDIFADLSMADRLIGPGHWSPFEHPAMALEHPIRVGNMEGFMQLRALVDHHNFTQCACGHPAEMHGPYTYNARAKKAFMGGLEACEAKELCGCQRFE